VVRPIQADDVAAELEEVEQIPLWDALIVVSAFRAAASVILSEDFQHGRLVCGIRMENPFSAA
jgi:predicted nucleic acid-binding protein